MVLTPTFSIFVPVFNDEKYIEQCLRSILNQSYKEFELYIHDDGSTDASYMICKSYADTDQRIYLSRQDNGNSISAMNEFIDEAKGKYIVFIDHDDYWHKDYLIRIYEYLQKYDADCAITSYSLVDEEAKELNWYTPDLQDGLVLDSGQLKIRFLTSCDVEGFRWNKIYKKRIFSVSGVKFPNTFPADIEAEYRLFGYVAKAVLVANKGYYYRQSLTSEVATVSVNKLIGFLDTFRRISDIAVEQGYNSEARYYLTWRSINCLFNAYKKKKSYNENEWEGFSLSFSVKKWLGLSLIDAIRVVCSKYDRQIIRIKFLVKTVIVYVIFN